MKNFNLTPELIIKAYSQGIFPMAETRRSRSFIWMKPKIRTILPIGMLRQVKTIKKLYRKNNWYIKINSSFTEVINYCASTRVDTWINAEIENVFISLNKYRYAHSVETWSNNKLIGGLYGLSIKGAFFGESMFSLQSGASKVALLNLQERLLSQRFKLLDCQFNSPHLVSLGSKDINNEEFMQLLNQALNTDTHFQ